MFEVSSKISSDSTTKHTKNKKEQEASKNKNAFGFHLLRNPASSGLFPKRWVRISPHRLHLTIQRERDKTRSKAVKTNVTAVF